MFKRILRALTNKRFWVWLFHPCWFLGHDQDSSFPPKTRWSYSREDWADGVVYYCQRCSEVKDPDVFDNQIWVRNLFARVMHHYIEMPIIRWQNRRIRRSFNQR